jgi:flagellar basal-body rod modification protein FlgD
MSWYKPQLGDIKTMAVSSVASTPSPGGSPALASAATKGAGALGQTDFLQLLMSQMRNQDPLNPVSGTDFVAQLAQFSTLQGQQQLNTNITQMLALQQVTQGASLIGKQITYTDPNKTLPASGTVSAVQINNGAVQLMVGKQSVALTQVQSIAAGK